jgi:tripartite-type tricarboxylate transporter receptor subunit TctC
MCASLRFLATVFLIFIAQNACALPPLKIIVPFPPGSSTDFVARIIAPPLGKELRRVVIIENIAGAEGYVGGVAAARSSPDGNTILLAPTSVFIAPMLRSEAQYQVLRDFAVVAKIGEFAASLLVVKADSVLQLEQLLVPHSLSTTTYATGNIAGVLTSGQFSKLVGGSPTRIPFKGEMEALQGVMGGHVDWMFALPTVALPLVQAGKLKVLAVGTSNDHPFVKNIKGMVPVGLVGWKDIGSLILLLVSISTPEERVQEFALAVSTVMQNRNVVNALTAQYVLVGYESSSDARAQLQTNIDFWQSFVRE